MLQSFPDEIKEFKDTYKEFILTEEYQMKQVILFYRKLKISGKNKSLPLHFPIGWYEDESSRETAVKWLETAVYIVDINSIHKEEMKLAMYIYSSNPPTTSSIRQILGNRIVSFPVKIFYSITWSIMFLSLINILDETAGTDVKVEITIDGTA